MPKPLNNSGRYMPGLDGLRAIAVFAVIAYHLGVKMVPGGLLGVGIFFVLSGYLITDILLKQQGQNKQLDLKTFWVRRARRLLPAMIIMTVLVCLWLLITDTARLISLKGDIGSALLYISNWYLIFHHVSYFESFGPPSPFGHLWSLAVEEQFYILWPLVLALVLRSVRQRGKLALWIIAAALVSAGTMAVLYEPGADPSRIYYGTDTRAFALLIGAALAVIWPSWKLSAEKISSRGRFALDAAGFTGFIIVLLMIAKTGEYDSFLYRGGMVLLAIATAAAVAAMAHPASKLARLIGSRPLRWLGVRSYGIYLYHYPVIVLSTPIAEAGEFHPVRALIQVIITVAIAELSWRFIEEPIRHGALSKLVGQLKHQVRNQKLHVSKLRALTCISILIVSCVSCSNDGRTDQSVHAQSAAAKPTQNSEADARNPDSLKQRDPGKQTDTAQKQDPVSTTDPVKQPDPGKPTDKPSTTKPVNGGTGSGGSTEPYPPADKVNGTAEKPPAAKNGITAIGDSVMLDVEPYLKKLVPDIYMDGKVGRQLSQATAVIEELKGNGDLGSTVIVELGTNGSFSSKQLNKLLAAISDDRRILLVNTRVPRNWQDNVNDMLADAVGEKANISLVDWYSASSGHKEFFAKDGVHLTKKGAQFYADLLVKAIG